MGSREGLEHHAIWQYTFKKHLSPGQGIHYLKVRQRQTFFTVVARLLTLGILSPTEVHIEGEVVSIAPLETHNLK
jgi:saccharopine dehydrogenase-like NADP-dependent oxidoreductase